MSVPPSAIGRLEGLNLTELRQRLFFLLGALVIYRLGTYIPVPGVDAEALAFMFRQQGGSIFDLFNMFSGGALSRFSIFALGVMPYISASIIMQLLTFVVPELKELQKEGETGRRKIAQWTRYGTVALSTFQAVGVALALQNQTAGGVPIVLNPGFSYVVITTITLVTGTMFLMWLGEQITERGLGNGISMIIFAGIVAGLPSALASTLELVRTGEMGPLTVILLAVLAVAVVAFVVYMERAQRRIPIHYARRQVGRPVAGGQRSFLPLKINMSGVIPPIFASSLILFPSTLASWFGNAREMLWLQELAMWLSPGQPLFVIIYSLAIIFFCFFYTAIVFDAKEIAENLKKAGALIPGIRPGQQTAEYLDRVMARLTFAGALYITAVCLLPNFLILYWNVPFYFGGTSLLIVVVVVMDLMSQIQTYLMSQQYEALMRKAHLKGFARGTAR